ncbi:DNA polymerase IV [Cobetia sp. 3AK]|uniref:DNA polymerase IV n=1 Tax=Cobetia sp. 3AK TaxID=3040020 RepID=UPI002448D7BC|nr:DNA polymerase IV [Cobetia sp. 3AK]MDH2372295.1 DNA polymerase IV [Cobetia sp. 3AK]
MRKILHADCDCFYAAVEMLRHPEWREVPIAIGGRTEQRGVIATCNYPARAFGVRSAMSTARALRLCPQLILVPPDFERYRAVSQEIQALFHELTPLVEPLSLDEAYLDVSDIEEFQGSATWMARWLKEEALKRTGVTLSIGVAANKFLAKIASDWEKPDGLTVITPESSDAFIRKLPVGKLHGVGPATLARLNRLEITTCDDIRTTPLTTLVEHFGKFGHRLHELSHGIDDRPVKVERERKSISVERTFDQDLPDLSACLAKLPMLMERLGERHARQEQPVLAKQFVKVRFNDFTSTTLESLLPASTLSLPDARSFALLMEQAWQRGHRPVRLLGVGVRLKAHEETQQLGLF